MRRINACFSACAGTFLFAACVSLPGCTHAGISPASPPAAVPAAEDVTKLPDISGTYTLVSINGTPLPYTMTHEPPGVRVTSGRFTINPDGTCSSNTAFVLPSGEPMSREVSATWTRDGSKLTMVWQGAGSTSGTIAGDTFTMDNEGQILAYRKAP